MRIDWHRGRTWAMAYALAAFVAAPGLLRALGVTKWWGLILVGIAAAAASVATVVVIDKIKRSTQRREDRELALVDTCITIAGRFPRIRELPDPTSWGVHPAPALSTHDPAYNQQPGVQEHVPPYIERDIDRELRSKLGKSGFVLLIGDSAAGKTRTAFEAVMATTPEHILLAPNSQANLANVIGRASELRASLVWLDDLERFLGHGGLTGSMSARLASSPGHHLIVGTMRSREVARYSLDPGEQEQENRHLMRDAREALEQAHQIRIPRIFSHEERNRAQLETQDPRIDRALAHVYEYGLAEYIAAGPQLLSDWKNAWEPGANPRGAALIAAAVDCYRAGFFSPLPADLLRELEEFYLNKHGGSRLRPENSEEAWTWATRLRRSTTALLEPMPGGYRVLDYLIDATEQEVGVGGNVAEQVVTTALRYANAADASIIGVTAYKQGRYHLAMPALGQATFSLEKDFGSDYSVVIDLRFTQAMTLEHVGRYDEAEEEYRAILTIYTSFQGLEGRGALATRRRLASLHGTRGRLIEAEQELRSIIETSMRLFTSDDPHTLATRSDLATILRKLDRLEEAEAEHRSLIESKVRLFGPEDPETLTSKSNLATTLHSLGRVEEAADQHQALVEARARILGPEHPSTLISRSNLAMSWSGLGRKEEAAQELRSLIEVSSRVLGPEHYDTLLRRAGLAGVMSDSGNFEEAEVELQPVVESAKGVLGSEHPETLTWRRQLAVVRGNRGQLRESETELRAVAETSARVLGAAHPKTLATHLEIVTVLLELGSTQAAQEEFLRIKESLKQNGLTSP